VTSAEVTRNRDNFCYRHPDRMSFVLCQKCMRTICPECQTQGAVGVVCPECMKQQAAQRTAAQKKAERRWGRGSGAVVTASGSRTPRVTYAIMAVTIVISLIQMIPGPIGVAVTSALSFVGYAITPELGSNVQPWRALSVTLVHGSFLHLFFNMLSLWMMGRILEPLLGRWRFLALYVISALAGSVLMAFLAFDQFVVGASGAIFGTFGALIVITRRLGGDITQILVIVGINLLIGFIPGFNVAWQAHLGGLIGGLVVGAIYAATRQRSQRGLQIGLLAGFALLLCASVFLLPVVHPIVG